MFEPISVIMSRVVRGWWDTATVGCFSHHWSLRSISSQHFCVSNAAVVLFFARCHLRGNNFFLFLCAGCDGVTVRYQCTTIIAGLLFCARALSPDSTYYTNINVHYAHEISCTVFIVKLGHSLHKPSNFLEFWFCYFVKRRRKMSSVEAFMIRKT